MKRIQKLKPFISELVVYLFVSCVLAVGLLTHSIVIRPTIISGLFSFALVVWLLFYIVSFVRLDFWATVDAVFRCYEETPLKFVEQFPYRASTFTDTWRSGHQSTHLNFYRVVCKDCSEHVTLIAAEYYELKPGYYIFVTGRHSKIIIDVQAQGEG